LGETFRDLAVQKECNVIEGHLLPDHVHMLISIPPKYAVSQVIGYMKGKSAIHIARAYRGRKKTSRARIFGLVVTLCPQSERMRKPSENISGGRRKKTVASIN
jgi:REP element-mobilizing transposase RayT